MIPKPVVAAVVIVATAHAFLPAPASSTVPRTVLVEEFGWAS